MQSPDALGMNLGEPEYLPDIIPSKYITE